jgi:glycosyltransferase involved in cell wall biosynthesis
MRLLTLTADYCQGSTWSGIGVAVARQAEALASLGCAVHVVSPRVASCAGNPHIHALARNRFPIAVAATDTVHLHSLSLAALACEIKRRFGCRLIYTAHTLPALELPGTWQGQHWSAVQDQLFESADHVFFLNPDDRREGERRVAGLDRRSSVLHHGIPAARAGRHAGRTVAFVGRFTATKGVDIAVGAVGALIERHADWRFVFAGGHGDAAEWALVRDLAHRYPAACTMTGWLGRDALEELYSSSGLLLVPSRYEPFGLVALEAMNRGVPVLCSSALRHVVLPDSGGRIVADHSRNAWIDAAAALMGDGDACRQMSLRGPAYVRRNFDPVACARRFLDQIAA